MTKEPTDHAGWSAWSRRRICGAIGAAAIPLRALGQSGNLLTLVLGFAPGGVVDLVGRRLAEKLGGSMGRTVIVDNKSGASGNVAAGFVARQAGDGSSILVTLYDGLVNTRATDTKVGFDPLNDLRPLALVGMTDVAMVVRSDLPASNLQELVALAKTRKDSISIGSSGVGSSYHLLIEKMKAATSASFVHVPYSRGGGAQMLDLIAGRLDAAFGTLNIVMPYVGPGKLRIIATAGSRRSGALPEIPTLVESGYSDLSIAQGVGMFASSATPDALVAGLNAQVVKVISEPSFSKWLLENGIVPEKLTAPEFTERFKHETSSLTQQLRRIGFKLSD